MQSDKVAELSSKVRRFVYDHSGVPV